MRTKSRKALRAGRGIKPWPNDEPPPITASTDIPVRVSAIQTPQCPHGNYIVDSIPYCDVCSDGFRLIVAELIQISNSEASRGYYRSRRRLDLQDLRQHALAKIFSKVRKIFSADNPPAYARYVARNAIQDLLMQAVNVRELTLTKMAGGKEDPSGDPISIDSFIKHKTNWSIKHRDRLLTALDDAMAALPTRPLPVSLLIRLWVGAVGPHYDEYSYAELAAQYGTTRDKIRGAIGRGLAEVRQYLSQAGYKLLKT
jgi:DNA-directed RNA polymerase specialized sigma24 family protein